MESTTYADVNLIPDSTYHYRLIAFNDLITSDTVEVSVKTLEVIISTPALIAGETTESTISFQLVDNSDNADGLIIERRKLNETSYTVLDTVSLTETTFIDTDLNHSTSYVYRIKAFNIYGESDYSHEVEASTAVLILGLSNENQAYIYPNPSVGEFRLVLGQDSPYNRAQLMDLSG